MDKQIHNQPLVSAIIIFFNVELYIEEAIESVISQSYGNWELLLCDDGSRDGSTRIAKEYAARYPDRIRYLEHDGHANRGMSATRNLGIRNAKGEFISWLDADDVWLTHKLQSQVAALQAHPEAAMVYNPLRFWYSWSGRREDFHRDFNQRLCVPAGTVLQPPELLTRYLADEHYFPSSVMVRTSILRAVGGYEESFRDEYEDVMANSKICLDYPVICAGESFYKYRQHEGSCCAETRRTGRQRSRYLIFLNKLKAYMESKGKTSGPAWDALQQQLQPYQNKIRYAVSERTTRIRQRIGDVVREAVAIAKRASHRHMPRRAHAWMRAAVRGRTLWPPIGSVHLGDLRRVTPLSHEFGWERGLPVDRYYIERFLARHSSDIEGRVLEIGDREYTTRFGSHKITRSDVLSPVADSEATIVADLSTDLGIPQNAFDCMILTQVFPFMYDVQAGFAGAVRALKPGGIMLLTVPGISQISKGDADRWGDYWRLTEMSVRKLLGQHFDPSDVEIHVDGNVLAATALLHGLAAEDLSSAELDHRDAEYPVIISVRARKPVTVRHDVDVPALVSAPVEESLV
jgi:glycosyltransferase involved in cell wall biosynthesis